MMLIIVMLFSVTMAQRPGYLARPTYPQIATLNDKDETTTTLNIRLGEINGTTEKIPVDARRVADFVNRIKQWHRQNDETTNINLNIRLGEINVTTEKILVDARRIAELANIIKQSHRPNIPNWHLTAEQIERVRNLQGTRLQNSDGEQQNRIPKVNLEGSPEVRPINVNSRFGGYYDLRSRFPVHVPLPIYVRPIRPVVTRPFFTGRFL